MKKSLFLLLLLSRQISAVQIGDVCHVEADYYWAGIWTAYDKEHLICDYWAINNLHFDQNDEAEDEFQTDTETMNDDNGYIEEYEPEADENDNATH